MALLRKVPAPDSKHGEALVQRAAEAGAKGSQAAGDAHAEQDEA